jgi:hypothetical protein
MEELRQDVRPVLRRDHLGQLEHGGDAQLSRAQRLDHLRKPLDELRRHLAVVGGTPRESELPVEVLEEVRKPQPKPEALPIEVRERQEKISHRAVLAAEEIGEAARRLACVVHTRIFSRVSATSPDARNRLLERLRARKPRTPHELFRALQWAPRASRRAFASRPTSKIQNTANPGQANSSSVNHYG